MKTTLKNTYIKLFTCQLFYNSPRTRFLCQPAGILVTKSKKESIPQLTVTEKSPVGLVHIIKDENAFQQYKAEQTAPINTLYDNSFKETKAVIVDFGEHITGCFSFSTELLKSRGRRTGTLQTDIRRSSF